MLLSARRAAFLAPFLLLLVIFATHLGARSGIYRSSRPESGLASFCAADGYMYLYDGTPVMSDVCHTENLGHLFRGAPGKEAAGINDERPLVPFLQCLLGAGFWGELWPGIFLNLLVAGAAAYCAHDLLAGAGYSPFVASAFACLLVSGRGTGFYMGTPDVHLFSCAWLPIGAWLFDRLELASPTAPRANVVAFGFVLGAALLTYLGCVALVGFVWIHGARRTSLVRLTAMTAIAIAIALSWRVLGKAFLGLPFDPLATSAIGAGSKAILRSLGEAFANAWAPAAGVPRGSVPNACLQTLRAIFLDGEPARIMFHALRPAFGDALLLGAFVGVFFAPALEKRRALALFLPAVVAAFPLNAIYNVPRITYPAVAGLSLLAAFALTSIAARVRSEASARGLGARMCDAIELALILVPLGIFFLHENSDLFGSLTVIRKLHFGS